MCQLEVNEDQDVSVIGSDRTGTLNNGGEIDSYGIKLESISFG